MDENDLSIPINSNQMISIGRYLIRPDHYIQTLVESSQFPPALVVNNSNELQPHPQQFARINAL